MGGTGRTQRTTHTPTPVALYSKPLGRSRLANALCQSSTSETSGTTCATVMKTSGRWSKGHVEHGSTMVHLRTSTTCPLNNTSHNTNHHRCVCVCSSGFNRRQQGDIGQDADRKAYESQRASRASSVQERRRERLTKLGKVTQQHQQHQACMNCSPHLTSCHDHCNWHIHSTMALML